MKFRYIDPGDIVSVIVVLVVLAIGLFCFSTVTQSINNINKTEISESFNITEFGDFYVGNFPFLIIVLFFILMFLFLYKARSGRCSADYELPKDDDDEESEEPAITINQGISLTPHITESEKKAFEKIYKKESDTNKKKYNWGGK